MSFVTFTKFLTFNLCTHTDHVGIYDILNRVSCCNPNAL